MEFIDLDVIIEEILFEKLSYIIYKKTVLDNNVKFYNIDSIKIIFFLYF